MDNDRTMLEMLSGEVKLLTGLVRVELERRCAAIDDIVVAGYGQHIGVRADNNAEEVKVAILELARSPLADLERKLACVELEPKEEPAEEVKPAEEEEPAEEPKQEAKGSRSRS